MLDLLELGEAEEAAAVMTACDRSRWAGTLQDLFVFQFQGERSDGTLIGRHLCTGYRPHFLPRAEYFGLGEALMGAMECLPPS